MACQASLRDAPNLDALTRGLKPHGYHHATAPRSSKMSKLQPSPPLEEREITFPRSSHPNSMEVQRAIPTSKSRING